MTETSLVTFNCPTKLLEDFDNTWKKPGRIRDRTAALLRAMEKFIETKKEAQNVES